MKRYTTNQEIENLCEAMIKDFFKQRHYTNVLCVDIESFVREYLGIPVVFEKFAENGSGVLGFISDGEKPLIVIDGTEKKSVVFPARTVVIEQYLNQPQESARKRFTIAHEGAHEMLSRHIPIQSSFKAAYHTEFDKEGVYPTETLKEMLSVNECLANRTAACFLMPRFLIERVLKRYNNAEPVIIYDGNVLSQHSKLLIQRMANAMGVSYSAFFNRLKELNMFDYRPIADYLHYDLKMGGDCYEQ